MAKLKVHGAEVGTIYTTTSAKRYMSDRVILKNIGFGWKLYGKVKPGIDPAEAFARAKAKREALLIEHPSFAAYVRELHDMAGLAKRWKLHAAVSAMPEDCDGVWSEACDGYSDNIHADIDEVAKLCRLYLVALTEAESMKKAA